MMAASKIIPLYRYPGSYAREHGELEQFRASRQANIACKDAIEKAINEQWDGFGIPRGGVNEVLREFGKERVSYVLAATVQSKSWDERFSGSNQNWAKTVSVFEPEEKRRAYAVSSHPAKLDSFVDMARREMERERKPSIRAQLAKKIPQDRPKQKRPIEREAR